MLEIMISKKFNLGYKSRVEDYVIINNGMGDVIICYYSHITSRVTIIWPVTIGEKVILAAGAHISGLAHNYEDINIPIQDQYVSTNKVVISNDVWIGGNCCINQGVKIGTHVIIGSGSVVTKDIPSYSIAVGNPARVIKKFNFDTKTWEKV